MTFLRKKWGGGGPRPFPNFSLGKGQRKFFLPRLNLGIPLISAKRMGHPIRIDLCPLFVGGRFWVQVSSTVQAVREARPPLPAHRCAPLSPNAASATT